MNYYGDGTGRDSYIVIQNGGLTKIERKGMQNNRFTYNDVKACYLPSSQKSPRKEATSFTYQSDGSGRDSYVLQNSGGLVNDFKGLGHEKFFHSTLRSGFDYMSRRGSRQGKDILDY